MFKTAKKIAIGAAVAGTAGYIAGLLTAPSSGKRTRKELKEAADSGASDLEKQLKKLHTELGDLVQSGRGVSNKFNGRTQKKFGQALDSAHASKDKLRQVLSSMHEGEANDKDLARALADAKNSLEHLKDFIKK